jgi:hypothetical protein
LPKGRFEGLAIRSLLRGFSTIAVITERVKIIQTDSPAFFFRFPGTELINANRRCAWGGFQNGKTAGEFPAGWRMYELPNVFWYLGGHLGLVDLVNS